MGELSKTAFAGITYGVMGMGTEGGSTPYRITVAANGGWGGTPIAKSGYSVGAMQFDFGQRGKDIDTLTGKPYAESFIGAVNEWAKQNNTSALSPQALKQLATNGGAIEWMSSSDRMTISAFGDTAIGKGWINRHLEKGLIAEYEAKVKPVLNGLAFEGWSEADILIAAAVLTKAANQSPNRGFVALANLTRNGHSESYTLDDFLVDTKKVEATNTNYHFTKSSEIAKEYVLLRESVEFGSIIEAAERKIADPAFTPASIGPDSDLWFMRKINSDPKFRNDLKAALVQIDANAVQPSVGTVGSGKAKSEIVLVPEDEYLEIQAPKGGTSVIVKAGEAYFYQGGDVEGRRNALKSIEAFENRDPNAGVPAPSDTSTGGTSISRAIYDLLVTTWKGGKDAVSTFFNGDAVDPNANDSTPGLENAQGTPVAPSEPPRTPHPSNSSTVKHDDKSITVNYTAKASNPDGSILKGDFVTYVQQLDGKTTYFSVRRTVGNETIEKERSVDPVTGEETFTVSKWVGSGPGSLRFQEQLDVRGNHVGDRYIYDGEIYFASPGTNGQTQWRNERGQTEKEWMKDPTNPSSPDAVNGLDLDSDQYPTRQGNSTPKDPTPSPATPASYRTVDIDGQTYEVTAKGTLDRKLPGQPGWTESRDSTGGGVIMDAVGGVVAELQPGDRVGVMDDGRITIKDATGKSVNRTLDEGFADAFVTPPFANANANVTPTNPSSPDAVNGADHQSDNYLNKIDLPLPQLASLLTANPGAFGAGQVGGLDILPFNDNSSFLTNADGDIAGEMTKLSNGWIQVKYISGNSVYVNPEAPRGDPRAMLTTEQYQDAQAKDAAGALGLVNSVIGLRHWDQQTDLGRLNSAVSLYNQIDRLGGALGAGNNLPGDFGALGAGLGFLSALESGDAGGIVVSGLYAIDAATATASAAGLVTQNLGAGFVPGISFLLALDSGDPYSIVSSGLSLMYALNMIPVWGQIAAVCIAIFGALFGGDDEDIPNLPMQEGHAQANWDESGNVYTSTTQDIEGGGASATAWMNNLTQGLQQRLAEITDASGNPLYGLIPARLPSLGFKFDPDGMNYAGAQGHLYLKWFDESGNEQTRYYDGSGSRGDDSNDTIAGDFMKHAQNAIVPNWEALTILAHWQESRASEGTLAANAQARAAVSSGLPQEAADHLTQIFSALSFDVQVTSAQSYQVTSAQASQQLIDIDADGYLELTQWMTANQAILAIDINGDNSITAGELLDLSGASSARNNLNWLDANGDQRLDARDPAFTALRVWIDVNQNGVSEGTGQSAEVKSFASVGITAIDFASTPPQIIRADGTSTALTRQHLTGDVLGVLYTATAGGLLEDREGGEVVLHAFNTREFDGDPAHRQGGDLDTDGFNDRQAVVIDPQDARLSSTTARTLANRPGLMNSGLGLGFIPLSAGSVQQAQRDATAAMVRSADSSLFGVGSGATPLVAMALGAGAVQWPTVVSAASSGLANQETVPTTAPTESPFLTSVEGSAGYGAQGEVQGGRLDATRVDLATLQIGQVIADIHRQGSTQDGAPGSAAEISASNQALARQTQAQAATNLIASLIPSLIPSSNLAGLPSETASNFDSASAGTDVPLDYPQVHGEMIAGTEDIGLSISADLLLANDSTLNAGNPSWPVLSISAVSQPVHGQVALRINEAGATEVVFVPEANYHGPASFAYTVTDQFGLSSVATAQLTISSVNDAPTPHDESASGDEDATLLFTASDLLVNDVDVDTARDGDTLRITRVGLAQHGMVFLDAGGLIRFVPDANYNGPAQFSYWVGDRIEADMAAANNGGVGLESPATMRLTILPVNDLPLVTGESLSSDEDVVLNINPALLLANDTDVDMASNGQTLTISAVSGAQHGAVSLLADGTIQFTPEQDYFGAASFVYTVSDGNGGYVAGTAVVSLASVNDVPVVNDELLIGKRDATYTLSQAALLANDTDVETPNGLSIVAVQGMTHGTAVLNANGSVTFTPHAGYSGRGTFEYVVQDSDGGQAVARTEIDFSAININPVAVNDSFVGFEDIAFVIQASQLLVNDSDPDAGGLSSLSVDAVRNASNGTVALQSDGSVRFVPAANFYGTATFEYRSNDGEGGQTWATAYLSVQSVNDAPVIEDIWYGDPVYNYHVWTFVPAQEIPSEYWSSYTYPSWQLAPVGSLAAAQQHAQLAGQTLSPPAGGFPYPNSMAGNQAYGLMTASGASAAYSFYKNGELRPNGFSAQDATDVYSFTYDGTTTTTYTVSDDVLRQHGSIKAYDPDGDSAAITMSVGSGPQHGHLWLNAYTPNTTIPGLIHTQAASTLVGSAGAWQYFSHFGDTYTGSDPFAIQVTDGAGASTQTMVYTSHYGTSPSGGGGGGGGGCFPVALDLTGNGIELIRPEDSTIFADINDDGWHERVGWAASGDGVLTFDADHNGLITQANEVSFVGYKDGALTDLEGLAAFDTDGDGKITANDEQWARLGVLQDVNANGLQDSGELRTLNDLCISSISLHREGTPHLNSGNVVFGTSAVQWIDGHITRASDVMFAGQGVALPDVVVDMLAAATHPETDGLVQVTSESLTLDDPLRLEQARVNQMTELFNQFVNTAPTNGPPLASVGPFSQLTETLPGTEFYTGSVDVQLSVAQNQSSLSGGGA